jgi:hypothetical protein
MKFFDVAESFEDNEVNAAFYQRFHLLAESSASLVERSFAEGLNADSQRPDRTGNPYIKALGSLAGEAGAEIVDVTNLVTKGMPYQAEGVSTKSVGFNYFGTSLQILVMDPANQVRLGKVKFIVTAVNENAFCVEKRAHGAITEHGGLLQAGYQVSGHSIENTRSV